MVTVTFKKKKLLEISGAQLEGEKLYGQLEQIKCVFESYDGKSDELALEVTPDRPDLLSVHGIARGLKGALGVEKGVPATRIHGEPALKFFAEKEALAIRPVIVGAVVEGVKLGGDEIAQLFETQDKLDATLGRKRRRVSIGLYDLDALTPPFYFRAVDPQKTKFVPLKSEKQMTLKQIIEEHPTGREYAHLVNKHAKFPVIADSAGEILSMAPVINNVTSAVTEKTTRLFIDHTGTDGHACNASLSILCQDFAEAGAKVSKVECVYPSGATLTPNTAPEKMRLGVGQANKLLGTQLSAERMAECLLKQRIGAGVEGDWLACEIPAYRGDFLHPVDLVEEIAIGFGYNNFEPLAPSVFTKGSLSEYTMKENALRDFMTGVGFLELCTYVLTNEEKIRKAKSEEEFAEVLNPVSSEYSVLRATLLPNVLEVLSENTHVEYPQKVFEVGEVVVPNHKLPERMQTKLHLCAGTAHAGAGLTEVASALSELAKRIGKSFLLEKLQNNQFIAGRAAKVFIDAKPVGVAGEVHPEVLAAFGLQVPVAIFEIGLND